MRRPLRAAVLLAAAVLAAGVPLRASHGADELGPDERARIVSLGPWPPPAVPDPRNGVSGNAQAAALGEALFHSTRLSTVGGLRCASCHEPWRHYTDGRTTALGAEPGTRNTPSLLNVRLQRRFGWDGASDTLWAQSVRPILDAREMRADASHVAGALRADVTLARLYANAFGHAPPDDDRLALADAGKALASYAETLQTGRTPFDDYRDAVQRGAPVAAQSYPAAAQRGLRLFVGAGRCIACHGGAGFSDGDLHASQVGAAKRGAAALFRTPGLRDVEWTGPYMHDGSIRDLCDAVLPHATFEGAPAPALSLAQRRDVVAFLRTLSAASPRAPEEPVDACR